MAWIALIISVIASIAALVALRRARQAQLVAIDLLQRANTTVPAGGLATAPGHHQLVENAIEAVVQDGDRLSAAGRAVIRALGAGREPPIPADYARVEQSAERFTASIGRLRAPEHGDVMRDLTDELVTLHHSLLTEIRQHQGARYPFVGARDSALAVLMLSKFDGELRRLRRYGQTGRIPEPDEFPVDFDTIRFIPRDLPAEPVDRPPPD